MIVNRYITALLVVLAATGVEAQNLQSALKLAMTGEISYEQFIQQPEVKMLEDDILSVIKAFKEADEEDDLQFNYISGLHSLESYVPANIIFAHKTKVRDFIQPILHILHPCSIVIRGPNK
jgi:hypothetical protein